MTSKAKNTKLGFCQNCGTKLDQHDNYCASCGQKVLPDHLTLKFFIRELLGNYFSFDSKFFNTVAQLLVKPAYLSIEFIEGRRIRYINPIQLFVFSSFLYFLINSFMFLKEETNQDIVKIQREGKDKLIDSLHIEQLDSVFVIQDGEKSDTIISSYAGKLLKKGYDFNQMDREDQNEIISQNISKAVFLLLPIFAFYLGYIFRRKTRHYLENIIFSLHFHAFYYILAIFTLVLDRLLTGDIDSILLNFFAWIYLFVAVKKFYQFSWSSTILRLLGLTVLYGLTVAIFLVCSILISVLL